MACSFARAHSGKMQAHLAFLRLSATGSAAHSERQPKTTRLGMACTIRRYRFTNRSHMSTSPSARTDDADVVPFKAWFILALMTLESIIAIIDRQAISALKTTLKAEFLMNDSGYSYLVNAFLIPYALFYPICGALVDRYGSRRTLSAFVTIWSLATLACGFARS